MQEIAKLSINLSYIAEQFLILGEDADDTSNTILIFADTKFTWINARNEKRKCGELLRLARSLNVFHG